MSHMLRSAVFFFPVQALITGLLLWLGFRSVRTGTFGAQVFLSVLSAVWVWAQLKHSLVI